LTVVPTTALAAGGLDAIIAVDATSVETLPASSLRGIRGELTPMTR
jgi:hypothetical protein